MRWLASCGRTIEVVRRAEGFKDWLRKEAPRALSNVSGEILALPQLVTLVERLAGEVRRNQPRSAPWLSTDLHHSSSSSGSMLQGRAGGQRQEKDVGCLAALSHYHEEHLSARTLLWTPIHTFFSLPFLCNCRQGQVYGT